MTLPTPDHPASEHEAHPGHRQHQADGGDSPPDAIQETPHEEHGSGHDMPATTMTGMDHGGMDHGMGGAHIRAPEDEADSLSLFGACRSVSG